MKDGAALLLGSTSSASDVKSISWKFSVPVFGKKSTTTAGSVSNAYDITKAIASGATIEGTEDVSTVKTPSKSFAGKLSKKEYVTYKESLLIISWWRIIFLRRISTCTTSKEYLETIEQYRHILYSRYAQYLSVYGLSVTHQQRRALEKSIEETKSKLEEEVFKKSITYYKSLDSTKINSGSELDIISSTNKTCQEVESKYTAIIAKTKKEEDSSSSEKSTEEKKVTNYSVNDVVVTIDTIHITIRYWFRTLYTQISNASKEGAKSEDVRKLIQNSHQELEKQLIAIGHSTTLGLQKTDTLDKSQVKEYEQFVNSALESSQAEVGKFVSEIDVSTEVISVESWGTVTKEVDAKLAKLSEKSKHSVIQIDETSKVEEVQEQVNEEDVQSSRIDIVSTLAESKAYVSLWFNTIVKDISWAVNTQTDAGFQKDALVIVEAAELDVISKIDETLVLIDTLSSRLTYLSWNERRHLVTYYLSVRYYLLAKLQKFKTTVSESKEASTILQDCEFSFSTEEQSNVLEKIDTILKTVTSEVSTDTSIAGSIAQKESGSVTVGVIAGGAHTGSTIETVKTDSGVVAVEIVQDSTDISGSNHSGSSNTKSNGSQSVSIGVISSGKETKSSDVEIVTENTGSITVGTIVTGKNNTLDSIVQDENSVTVDVIGKSSKIDQEKTSTIKHVEAVAGGVIAGGIIAGVVAEHKQSSKTDSDVKVTAGESHKDHADKKVLVTSEVDVAGKKTVTVVDEAVVSVVGEQDVDVIKVVEDKHKHTEGQTVVVSKEKLTGKSLNIKF